MGAYADVAEYRRDTGDSATDDARVESTLVQQSAKLRALAGITESRKLTGDQAELARYLVVDAARKALVTPCVEGLGDMAGVKQSSFTANGFQGSYTFANSSGSAYFDRDTLRAFMRSLGKSQRMGYVYPGCPR